MRKNNKSEVLDVPALGGEGEWVGQAGHRQEQAQVGPPLLLYLALEQQQELQQLLQQLLKLS
jgi:hypothetical protein